MARLIRDIVGTIRCYMGGWLVEAALWVLPLSATSAAEVITDLARARRRTARA